MYLVVSHWKIVPGHEEAAETAGRAMRDLLRKQPGVLSLNSIESNGKVVVVHTYADEDAYNRVVSDPTGVFENAAKEHKLEEHMEWIGSDRGPTRFDE